MITISVRRECRWSAVPLCSCTPLNRVPLFLAVPCKKLDAPGGPRATSWDVPSALPFCAGCPSVAGRAFSLKQSPCPQCGCVGTLNRHSHAFGQDPLTASGQWQRGQRVYCSNRGLREGCGRTFSVFVAEVLPRHTFTASLVWQWLLQRLAGLSGKAAAERVRLPFTLEAVYRLRRSLVRRLDAWRTRLARERPPPVSTQTDPLLQTAEHLREVFPGSACPPADFQLH